MAFSTILTIVIIGYILIYIVMIAYDIFLKKEIVDLVPKYEDEDVDISDEAGSFKPILVEKEPKKDSPQKPPDKDLDNKAEDPTQGNKETGGDTDVKSDKEDDDQPVNRKPLSDKSKVSDEGKIVETNKTEISAVNHSKRDDNVSDKPSIENSEKDSTNWHNNVPKLDIENIEEEKPVMELDFDNEDIPYVRIDLDEGHTKMSGAVVVEELVEKAKDLSENGGDSEFGKIVAGWEVLEREQDKEGYEELKLLMADNSNCSSPPPMLDLS